MATWQQTNLFKARPWVKGQGQKDATKEVKEKNHLLVTDYKPVILISGNWAGFIMLYTVIRSAFIL